MGVLTGLLLCVGCSSPKHELAIAKVDIGEQWPFTVDAGTIACREGSHVVFVANGRTYAINGTAKSAAPRFGYADDTAIRVSRPLGAVQQTVDRLPEPQRKRIFVAAEKCDQFTDDALDACRRVVSQDADLQPGELARILDEGVTLGWPPLKPFLASVAPIIEMGLDLCRS